jgi:uncharacterized membrane protein
MNDLDKSVGAFASDPAASASVKALIATVTGSGTLFWGGYTSNDIAMFIGAIVAVVGLAVQWYYRHAEYKLRQREHQNFRDFYDQG